MTSDSTSLSWRVPCDQVFTLSITIGGSTYRMKNEQLISLDSTGTLCTSLVKGWANPVIRAYLFGAPFATSAYIVYNAQQDQSGDEIGVAQRAVNPVIMVNQGVPTTVLIATIVGSVCGMGFVVVGTLCYLDRRRRQDSDTRKTKTKTKTKTRTKRSTVKFEIEALTDEAPPSSATPMLSPSKRQRNYILVQGPIGGEPSGGGVLEPERERPLSSPRAPPWSPDGNEPNLPPDLTLVQRSQIMESSVPPPEPIPRLDVRTVVRPLPAPSGRSNRPYHSFYGQRVPSVVIAPEPGGRRHQSPEVPGSPIPPPTYFSGSGRFR